MDSIDFSSPRAIVFAIRRHWGKSVLVALLIAAAFVAAWRLLPRKYASEAKLFVRVGRESVQLDPTATTSQTIALTENREIEINSILEVLRTRSLLEKVLTIVPADEVLGRSAVGGIQLGGPAPSEEELQAFQREQAIERLTRTVWVDAPKRSSVITIYVEASSPQLARKIGQAVLTAFKEEHAQVNRTAGSYEFFAEEAKTAERRLQRANDALRDAKNEVGLATVDGQRQILENQLSAVSAQLLTTSAAIEGGLAKVAELQEKVAELPERVVDDEVSGLPNVAGDGMRQRLYELQIRERELAAQFTDNHPQLRSLREQLADAQKLVDEQPAERTQTTGRLNRLRENLEFSLKSEQATLTSLQKQSSILAAQREQTLAQLRKLNDDELRLADLSRDVDLARSQFQSYADKLEQARINQALDAERISNVNVVQQPTLVLKPVSPRLSILAAVGLAAAMLGGLGTALLAVQLDPRMRTPAEVERELELPVVMSMPRALSRRTVGNGV